MSSYISTSPNDTADIDQGDSNYAALGTAMPVGRKDSEGYGGVQHAALKFDLSSILSSATVLSAQFQATLYAEDTNTAHNVLLKRFVRSGIDWDDMTWQYYDKSATASWATLGASGAGDVDVTLSSKAMGTSPTFQEYTFSLTTSYIQAWVDGSTPNRGFMMMADNEPWEPPGYGVGTETVWRGPTYGTTSQRPELTIEYYLPAPGIMMWWGGLGCGSQPQAFDVFRFSLVAGLAREIKDLGRRILLPTEVKDPALRRMALSS